MAQSTENAATGAGLWPAPPLFTTPADAVVLRDVARRCSPAIYEAACRFRRTGDSALLPVLIPGLIERYVDPDLRVRLRDPAADLRLREDLGLDSLTLIEFVMFAEDVLQIAIDNSELAELSTLADVQRFTEARLAGLAPAPRMTALLLDPG